MAKARPLRSIRLHSTHFRMRTTQKRNPLGGTASWTRVGMSGMKLAEQAAVRSWLEQAGAEPTAHPDGLRIPIPGGEVMVVWTYHALDDPSSRPVLVGLTVAVAEITEEVAKVVYKLAAAGSLVSERAGGVGGQLPTDQGSVAGVGKLSSAVQSRWPSARQVASVDELLAFLTE
jgi:hypothetical protein